MARYWRCTGRGRWTFCCEAPESAASEKPKLLTLVMARAIELYRALGFVPTEPYCVNPVPGALYLEKPL